MMGGTVNRGQIQGIDSQTSQLILQELDRISKSQTQMMETMN